MDVKEKPFLFMAHVSYAGGIRASARQFDCKFMEVDELSKRGLVFGREPAGGSLLANSFNQAWCKALNMQDAGWNVKWFVMCHDDVVPEDWFVRTLLEDLESTGADMISALVPLKDPSGCTSTAIDDHGDNFSWERRVTLKEAETLPEVFEAADCGFPDRLLLANTGCWICRFDRPWLREKDEHGNLKVFFTINDRIRKDTNSGQWIADVEPEDWFISRRIQEAGGKVMVSRRVKLAHWGLVPFPNHAVNGLVYGTTAYDYAFAEKAGYAAIGEARPEGDFTYDSKELADVRGWLNDSEGQLLAKYAAGKRVLEVGSYCGRSTIWMGRVAESVLAVDTWDGRGTPAPHDTLPEFLANIERHGLLGKVTTGGGTLAAVKKGQTQHPSLGEFTNPDFGPFDFIFIDGDHSEAGVKADIEEALPLLAPGGLMAFHDYGRPTDPGVKKMVDALLLETGSELLEKSGTVAIIQVNNGGRHETRPAIETRAEMCGTGPADCGTPSETLANGHATHFVCSWRLPHEQGLDAARSE